MYGNDGFRELDRRECLERLAEAVVGRVVFTQEALPAVLPFRFWLDRDGAVVLRTSSVSEMARAVDGAVVAFEADEVDAAAHAGWSVVVTGVASVIADAAERERLRERGPRSWVSWPGEIFVRIAPELVTGRELLAETVDGVRLSR
ncbi:pyridoxamine 5'-phosphate oxidase family protein [Streptomyces ardesiacus]|uniref:pyridoxamine 5'-phosphate oxidase family protein n=1 Tax=Streptomyces ardesiacus TaxID=285564 RepID=UPI00201ECC50|nr:pyridoxamine 5'-phosphate oxidase family protein [Streptomyces ardesiacus]MCL7366740.1 pyridoxamine 5'-phosphate oxidase family protein [Streptomyces ardesiacus]